jgi:hypothetical protein
MFSVAVLSPKLIFIHEEFGCRLNESFEFFVVWAANLVRVFQEFPDLDDLIISGFSPVCSRNLDLILC